VEKLGIDVRLLFVNMAATNNGRFKMELGKDVILLFDILKDVSFVSAGISGNEPLRALLYNEIEAKAVQLFNDVGTAPVKLLLFNAKE
jgi:hypothetical protein